MDEDNNDSDSYHGNSNDIIPLNSTHNDDIIPLDPTDNDDEIPLEDPGEDESEYMNVPTVKLRSDSPTSTPKEKPSQTKRPLSNYCNVAPLPEPTNQNGGETKTVGQATANVDTTDASDESGGGYVYKPKYRAPARPPAGHKKLPPMDPALVRMGNLESKDVPHQIAKESSNFNRNRTPVKKTVSNSSQQSPPPPPSKPIPTKPPRNRAKHDTPSPLDSPCAVSPHRPTVKTYESRYSSS